MQTSSNDGADKDKVQTSGNRKHSKSNPPGFGGELAVVVLGDPFAVRRCPENILLGNEPEHCASTTLERRCKVLGRPLLVLDLSPFLHTDQTEEIENLALQCMNLSTDGIHAFLLLVPAGQAREQNQIGLQNLQKVFGSQALDFTVLILTYVPEQRENLAEIMKDSQVRSLKDSCRRGVITCSNAMADDKELEGLIEKVDALPEGSADCCYTRRMYQDAWLRSFEAYLEHITWQRKQINVEHINELRRLRDERDDRIIKLSRELEALWTGGELRIVVLGITAAGKTSTVNAILGEKTFDTKASRQENTRACTLHSGTVNGRCITVLDTPGFQHISKTDIELMKYIKISCEQFLAPGPHAFLFVVRPDLVSQKDLEVPEMTAEVFGGGAMQYSLVVVSCMGQTSGEGGIGDEQHGGQKMQQLLKHCGGRHHFLNLGEMENHKQVSQLVEMVDEMVQGCRGECYMGEPQQPELNPLQEDDWIRGLKDNLQSQWAMMERRKEELQREKNLIQRKEENIQKWRDAMANDEEMLEKLKKYIEQHRTEVAGLEESMAKVLQTIESLQTDIECGMREIEKECEHLQTEKEALANEKLAIELREDMSQKERDEKLEELEIFEQNLENKREQLMEREKMIQRKEEMLEEKMKMLKVFEEQREHLGSEMLKKDGLIKAREEEMKARRRQIDVETGEMLNLRKRTKTNEEEYEKTKTDLQLREEDVRKYESKLHLMWQEVERRRRENKKLEAELARQREEMKRKDEEVQVYKEALRQLEEVLMKMEKERDRDAREIEDNVEELRRLREELSDKDREKEEELRKKQVEIERYQKEMKKLMHHLRILEKERSTGDQAEGQEGHGDRKSVPATMEAQKKDLEAKMMQEKGILNSLLTDYVSSSKRMLLRFEERIRMHRKAEEKKTMAREEEFKLQIKKLRQTLKTQK